MQFHAARDGERKPVAVRLSRGGRVATSSSHDAKANGFPAGGLALRLNAQSEDSSLLPHTEK